MARLNPNIYIEVKLTQYPASLGTLTYRWAKRPMADAGAWKEQRLISISSIRRVASDAEGNYAISTVTAILNDQDAVLRTLLEAGTTTEYFTAREATVYLISDTGRVAGVDPRPIFRGFIDDVQALPDRQVSISIVDAIGSQFGAFNLDKTLPSVLIKDISEFADKDIKNLPLPIYCGEFSDAGAVDVNGNSVEKGLLPVFDLGDIDTDTGLVSTAVPEPPPSGLAAQVFGSGSNTYYYGFTLITPYGESTMSQIVMVSNAPSVSEFSPTKYIALSGTYNSGPTGENRIRVWGRTTSSPTAWLGEATYDVGAGTFTYNDGLSQIDNEKTLKPPQVNYAIQSDTVWTRFAVCIGYSYEILGVFASDLADSTDPKRVRVPDADYGVTVLRPEDPGWPHPDPWIEENGIRYTAIYARGPIVRHHREGAITIAVSICGPHDDADLVIDQAGRAYEWLFNEHILKNGGTGYRNGEYWPLETYDNGDPMLLTSKFESYQDDTKVFMGDTVGYTAGIAIVDSITVREIIRRSALSHGMRWAHNHFGQIFPFAVNDLVAPTGNRHFRRHIEIHRPIEQRLAHDEVSNYQDYVLHYDPDAADFRFKGLSLKDDDSIAAHTPGGVVGSTTRRGIRGSGDIRAMFYTNDPDVAGDVVARDIAGRSRRPRYVSVPSDLTGMEYEISTGIRITDYDGLGPDGDVETVGLVLGVDINVELNEVVLITQDIGSQNRSVRITSEEFSIHISDSVQVGGLFPTEGIGVVDTVTALLVAEIALSNEVVGVADDVTASRGITLRVDSLKVSDSVQVSGLMPTERILLSDSVSVGTITMVAVPSEAIRPSDALATDFVIQASISEALKCSEAVTV